MLVRLLIYLVNLVCCYWCEILMVFWMMNLMWILVGIFELLLIGRIGLGVVLLVVLFGVFLEFWMIVMIFVLCDEMLVDVFVIKKLVEFWLVCFNFGVWWLLNVLFGNCNVWFEVMKLMFCMYMECYIGEFGDLCLWMFVIVFFVREECVVCYERIVC